MKPEMLDTLIGKFIDSEITPAEQRLLDNELAGNPQSRQLLRDYQQFHEQTEQALAAELADAGRAPRDIFDAAWAELGRASSLPRRRWSGWFRFVSGLAAGLLIGLGLYVYFVRQQPTPPPPSNDPGRLIVERDDDKALEPWRPRIVISPELNRPRIIRNVDWYNYIDESGDQYLVEGYRENTVTPAAYHGDL